MVHIATYNVLSTMVQGLNTQVQLMNNVRDSLLHLLLRQIRGVSPHIFVDTPRIFGQQPAVPTGRKVIAKFLDIA